MESSLPLDRILQGDSIEVLDTLPDKSVDLIFADPPYNLQLRQELYRPNHTLVAAVDDEWDRVGDFQQYDAFSRRWLEACRRVLKDDGTIWVIGTYHNIYRIGAIMQDLGFWFLNDIVWIKTNPMPNFRGVRFTNAHETLLWACRRQGARYTFNHHAMKNLNEDLQMRSDWLLPLCGGPERLRQNGKKVHSTQKPEALLYRVILAASNAGDVVLDPFFGSGTTGAVAKKLGRHWIGIEKEPLYIAAAQERIAAIEPDGSIASLDGEGRRRQNGRRVPFGNLLEAGLLHPGQRLVFAKEPHSVALIKADGRLKCAEIEGSIHKTASILLGNTPANGWDLWCYEDENGRLCPIDDLRQKILALR